jgi:hypothetical protein
VKSILRRLPPAPRKRGIGGRPSPALVISMIALFVSLSGVSYGVATGFIDSREIKNNEIRSIDIRNNEVRTRDLRNNEVRGIDIRNSTVQGRDIALNTVTGEDVKEDTLGKVPSALLADSSTTATTADSVSTLKTIPQTTVAEGGSSVALATQGPLTLRATCAPGSAGATDAGLTVATTEDNSAAGGESNIEPDLDAAGPPYEIAVLSDPATAGRSAALTKAFASGPSGKAFTGQIALYADAAGAGSCMFHGYVVLQG